MTTAPFILREPMRGRNAYMELRQQMIEHLTSTRPAVGEPFLTDKQLVEISGLSRMTVRRALEDLHRAGWIERRNGRGTFVGPRVLVPSPSMNDAIATATPRATRTVTRVAVLVRHIGNLDFDWYTMPIVRGLDQVAGEHRLGIELLGDDGKDQCESICRRLANDPPDVLACLEPQTLGQMRVLVEAIRLGVKVVRVGSCTSALDDVPSVSEDDLSGATMATRHLLELGHRRIGFIQEMRPDVWVERRWRGYQEAMSSENLDPEAIPPLWLRQHHRESFADATEQYIRRNQLTAVVFGSFWSVEVRPAIDAGRLVIPRDVSVVIFDNHRQNRASLGGIDATTVDLPLIEIGRRLGDAVRTLADGGTLPAETLVPCTLTVGQSCQRIIRRDF